MMKTSYVYENPVMFVFLGIIVADGRFLFVALLLRLCKSSMFLSYVLLRVIMKRNEVIRTTPKELMKKLKADGWYVDRIRGSHHIMLHPSKPGELVVPMHRKDIPVGLFHFLLKKAGLK